MTIEQFATLKPGDVILVRGRDKHTVTSLPRDGNTMISARDENGKEWSVYFRDAKLVK